MAGTKVDPPPLNVPLVDGRGYPTRALSDFLHRLWKRTGGSDDEVDALLKLMTGGSYMHQQGQAPETLDQDVIQLSLQGTGSSALKEQFGGLQALSLLAQVQRYASEIAALRAELDSLKALRTTSHTDPQARQDAESGLALSLATAHFGQP